MYFNSKYLLLLVEKLNRECRYCSLMGDFNIHLMKVNSEYDSWQFCNTMCSYFFTALVLQSTRVTDKSKTLFSNFFFISFEFNALSGNMDSIFDHLAGPILES